jgi:hypothetical protein
MAVMEMIVAPIKDHGIKFIHHGRQKEKHNYLA